MKKQFFTKLSAVQIKQLCILAKQAFKAAQARLGAVDDDMDAETFRKQGQIEAVGRESLRLCNQSHYLELLGKWFTVIGNLEAAFYAFLNAGPQNEFRRQMAWRLMGQIYSLAKAMEERENTRPEVPIPQQAWAYAQHIAKDKFKGRQITSLEGAELEQLGFTVVNRTNGMRDVGKPDGLGRNKKQRLGLKQPSSKSSETAFERPLKGSESGLFSAGLSIPETSRQDSRGDSQHPTDSRLV